MIDFKVDKTKDCIVINTDNWIQENTLLQRYKISGQSVITYITEVVDKNIVSEKFKNADSILEKGEIVLISKVASEIARDRAWSLKGEKYGSVPVMQVIGNFKEKEISLKSLNLFYGKILIERINPHKSGIIQRVQDNTMIGKVVKIGMHGFDHDWNSQPLTVSIGDIVLVKDNVSTLVRLDGQEYYAIEESSIVGIFKENGNYSLDNLRLINNSILLEEYIDTKLMGSELLETPQIDYKILDYTDVYNINLFKILAFDERLSYLNKNDKVIINRDMTNYVYLENSKYFLLNGMTYVYAKIS